MARLERESKDAHVACLLLGRHRTPRQDLCDPGQQALGALGGAPYNSVELLGFGEALHGGEELLLLRNRLFERLVTAHGYSAIAVESSFPKGHIVNEYIAGRGPATYAEIQNAGFSRGFGQLAANLELVEWMRQYNCAAYTLGRRR